MQFFQPPQHPEQVLQKIAHWLLAALVFFLPWQTRLILIQGELNNAPWEYGTVSLYGVDLLVLLFLIIGMGALLTHKKQIQLTSLDGLLLLLTVISFFSILFADNTINGLFWWFKLTEGLALAFVISHLNIPSRLIAWAFVVTGAVQSVIAITQFIVQEVWSAKWFGMAWQHPETLGVQVVESTELGRILRAYGSLPHPNILGGILVLGILAAVILYLHEEKWEKRWKIRFGLVALLAIESTALWMSFSRQAWIGLTVALGAIVLYQFVSTRVFPKKLTLSILYILIPFCLFSALFPSLIATRIQGHAPLENRSINERQLYMEQSVDLLRDEWITGVGIGNYTATLHQKDKTKKTATPGFAYQPVHNIYILLFTELGIFGLFTMIFIIAQTFFQSLPQAIEQKKVQKKMNIWLFSLSALLIIGLFDHYLWTLHVGILLFWIIIGLAQNSKSQ